MVGRDAIKEMVDPTPKTGIELYTKLKETSTEAERINILKENLHVSISYLVSGTAGHTIYLISFQLIDYAHCVYEYNADTRGKCHCNGNETEDCLRFRNATCLCKFGEKEAIGDVYQII